MGIDICCIYLELFIGLVQEQEVWEKKERHRGSAYESGTSIAENWPRHWQLFESPKMRDIDREQWQTTSFVIMLLSQDIYSLVLTFFIYIK